MLVSDLAGVVSAMSFESYEKTAKAADLPPSYRRSVFYMLNLIASIIELGSRLDEMDGARVQAVAAVTRVIANYENRIAGLDRTIQYLISHNEELREVANKAIEAERTAVDEASTRNETIAKLEAEKADTIETAAKFTSATIADLTMRMARSSIDDKARIQQLQEEKTALEAEKRQVTQEAKAAQATMEATINALLEARDRTVANMTSMSNENAVQEVVNPRARSRGLFAETSTVSETAAAAAAAMPVPSAPGSVHETTSSNGEDSGEQEPSLAGCTIM